jgi:hypothetical protein
MKVAFLWLLSLSLFELLVQQKASTDYQTILKSSADLGLIIENNEQHFILIVCDDSQESTKGLLFEQFLPAIEELNAATNEKISYFAVNDAMFNKKFGLKKFPQVLFFRRGNYITFKGKLTVDSLLEWVELFKEKKTIELYDSSFEHDTQASTGMTTGDWFVIFYPTQSTTKLIIEPEWEEAAADFQSRVNFAYVDFEKNPLLKKRFDLKNSLVILFFRSRSMYRYELSKHDSVSLLAFANGWYKNVKAENIPLEKAWFDETLETIVATLKEQGVSLNVYILTCFLFLTTFSLGCYFGLRTKKIDIKTE